MVLLDFDDAVYKRHKGALEAGWMSLICPPYHLFKTRQLDDLVVQKERSRGMYCSSRLRRNRQREKE